MNISYCVLEGERNLDLRPYPTLAGRLCPACFALLARAWGKAHDADVAWYLRP